MLGKEVPTSKKPKSLNELYTAPDDDMMLAFAGKREHPGLLAGCSHGKVGANEWNCFHERIPQLSIDFTPFRDYEWAPLARRVDIDKVYQVIEDSKWFEGVEAVSFADFNPWSQMSLYKVDEYLIECEFRGIGSRRRKAHDKRTTAKTTRSFSRCRGVGAMPRGRRWKSA